MTKLRCTRCGKKINKFTVPKVSSDVLPIQGGLPWGCKLQGSLRSKKDNRSMVRLNTRQARKDAHNCQALAASLKERIKKGPASLVGNKG
ncbi:MAG: hypothetical protein R6T98_03720, partial [Desulfatiglandales bacterium]